MAEMANLAASRLVGDVDGSTRAAATGALLPADQRATPRAKHAGKGSASRGDRAGMRERPMNVVVAPVASSSGGFVASDDDDAGSSHAEARAQLLRLISQHAGEELLGSDDSSSDDGARLGFGNSPLSDGLLKKLTPPKLAMKEIEARKEAAAREAEELMRRQNAVHELLQTVAKQNESRIKRAKEHMAPDGRSPSQGTVFKPPNSSSDSNDEAATPTAVPAKVVDDDDDAETSQKPWEGDRPWRENIRPSFWEERERRERERKAAESHRTGANKVDLKSRPAWGATIPLEPARGSHPGKKPAGLEAAQSRNPEDTEKRRAEVKKFLADSKRKWREKIAAEKAELEAKRTHRAAMKKAEDERSRMMAQQAAAERAKRGVDAPAKPKPKPKPMHLEWVDPADDDAPKSLADLAITVKPAPAPEVEIPEPVDIQPMVQKGAAKTHAAAEKNNVPETEAEDAKPVITYKPLKMKPKSPEKPVPAPRKESPAKPKPNPLGSFESELVAIQAELDASVDAHAAALALTAAAPRIKRIAAGREDLTRGEDSFSQATPSSSFAAPTNAKEEAEARRRAGEEAAEKRRQAKVLKDVARRLADTIDNLALAQIAGGGPTSSGMSRDASPVFRKPKTASRRIEVEEARETTSAEEEAAAVAVQSAFRGHVARKGVRAEINAGILKPSRAQTSYTHASGRHITFSPKIDDGGEGGAGGARGDGSGDEVDEDDVEVVFDDETVQKSLVPATSPERQPPMPRPRLLGVKTGRPGTHTVLPNDEHVPKPEDWLAQGSSAHRKLEARLARHRPTLDVDAPYDTGKMSQDKIDALAAAAFGSKEERRAARAAETLALPAPTVAPQPREPVGIFSLYTRRAAAAAAAAAVSSETARVAEELEKKLELEKDTAVRSSQTEPLALVYERVEAPSPARPAALPAPAEKKKASKKEKKEKKKKKEKREKKAPTPSPTKPPIEEPTEPAERWARRQLELERREEPPARLALSADLSPRQKAAMTALSAEVSSDGDRPTAGELEHQLRSELNLFDEMGEMAEELSQLQQQQELFQAEQVATALAQALETERERIRKQEENARAQMARAKELEETYVRRAEELEKTAMETAARVREESLRQVREVTEMFVKSLASGTAVERAAAAELVSRGLPAAGALTVEAAFGSPASVEKPLPEEDETDEEEHGVVPTVDADLDPDVVLAEFDAAAEAILRGEKSDAAAKMLADAAAATAASKPPGEGDDHDDDEIEDEIGYVDVRPAPESDDDTSIVDEVGVVERSELSVTASSIPEESIPHVQGSTRGSKSSSSRGLAVSDEPTEPSPTRSEESFDDRYQEVTAKHEDVQRRLRARQKTLRAAELAAKQAKIREMELELARLEQVDGLTLADEAKFEAEVAEYDVEHKLRAHQERLAQLEETVEAKRLEALALRKMKSVERELAREIHTLDDDIERIGSAAATPLSGGSPIKRQLTPVNISKTSPVKRSGGRPSSPSPEPPLVGEEDIPEESIATEIGSYDSDVFQPIPAPAGSARSPNRSPRSSMGSDTSGGHPHSPLELHPPAHAVSPPKKKGGSHGKKSGSPGKKSGSPGSSSVSEIHSSVSEIHSPETSIRTDAYSEDDFEPPGTDTESAASSGRTVRTRDVTGESPSLSGEATSLLGVLHSHLLGEALDDVAAVAFGEPAGIAADPGSPLSPAPAAEDLVRRATATRAASLARVAIERCGADASALKSLDFFQLGAQTAEPENVGLAALADATSRRRCSDRLVFDAVREVLLESLPLVGVYGVQMGSGQMDGLIEVVSARAATVMDPPHGGRVAVDDVVKDDVKASDDEGWYDVVSTEKAILTRLAEELFDDVVEDTVLSLMFGK